MLLPPARLAALILTAISVSTVLAAYSAPVPAGEIGPHLAAVPTLETSTLDITPPLSATPLVNPGMGLYLFGTLNAGDMPPDAWFSPILNIGYFRDDWSKLEPDAEGQYHFDEYFKPIFDLWVNHWGKRVAFRFMSQNMHSRQRYVTPKWVFDAGTPGVVHRGLYAPEQVDPVFWDDRYLAIQERFIAALGKYLDGRPGLEFIDIGCIGEWGEMHLARWTPDQLEQTGYTTAKYITAYRRVIDAFARAFPHTRVFLNVGDYDTINDYAAIHGMNFRQDGLNPSGPSANVGKRFYVPYSRRGVVCNYELFSSYNEMKEKGWGVKETFEKGLEDPISYLHINLMSYRELAHPPQEVKDAVLDAAGRIGFRFAMTHLQCNRDVHVGKDRPGRLLIASTWKNLGVAPCYDSYALRWTLVNSQGEVTTQDLQYPPLPTTRWWQGEEVPVRFVLRVPAGTAPGAYHLQVEMFKPEQPDPEIQLGMDGRNAAGRYDLCAVQVQPQMLGPAAVYSQGFETGTGGWTAAAGMNTALDVDAHSGKQSLLVSGTQPGGAWEYAAGPRLAVLAGSRYRLSAWLKVDRLDPPNQSPYLKLGVNDAAGKWITNFLTDKYDMTKTGTWQLLTGTVETPADAATGDITIEKGGLDLKVSGTMRLDDVQLDLLESP